MIKLDVKPYCHDCPNFRPVTDVTHYFDRYYEKQRRDTIITCEQAIRCAHVADYLQEQITNNYKGGKI